MNDSDYFVISGTVNEDKLQTDTEILVWVNGRTYRAYHTGENGYLLYLKKTAFSAMTAAVDVYLATSDACIQVLSADIALP